MKADDELEDIFKPKEYSKEVSSQRVDQVIKKVQHEQQTNDLVTLSFGKSFTTLMTILAPLFAWIDKEIPNNKKKK